MVSSQLNRPPILRTFNSRLNNPQHIPRLLSLHRTLSLTPESLRQNAIVFHIRRRLDGLHNLLHRLAIRDRRECAKVALWIFTEARVAGSSAAFELVFLSVEVELYRMSMGFEDRINGGNLLGYLFERTFGSPNPKPQLLNLRPYNSSPGSSHHAVFIS